MKIKEYSERPAQRLRELICSLSVREKAGMPVTLSMGMHISTGRMHPAYYLVMSLAALGGLLGAVFTFATACENSGSLAFDKGTVLLWAIISWAVFSAFYGLHSVYPKLSCALVSGGGIITILYTAANFFSVKSGGMYIINKFMSGVFDKYRNEPVYNMPDLFTYKGELISARDCGTLFMVCLTVFMAMALCRTVKIPNLLLFICATFPLPELCLYFGMVPSYGFFILLCISWCAAAAMEIARFGLFSGSGTERLFSKVSAQSALCAALIMLLCFGGAFGFLKSGGGERSESADSIRTSVRDYMKSFTWKKFSDDVKDAFFSGAPKELTHDGKLGNSEKVSFTGEKMLEVTLPDDADSLYLKGFTGSVYTGSRWEKGPDLPRLETNLTSPEFLGGRIIKHIPAFSELAVKNVVVRSTGVDSGIKYYPINSAGLLETDGVRRRYGVYFPEAPDWREDFIAASGTLVLDDTLASDEEKMSSFAYSRCLDVPSSFTAAEDFFKDFEEGDVRDVLIYIRSELSKRCKYTLNAGKKPFGADFAQWFLTENKQGSCTHFASATVLLCRSMGIPARYCEGFIIKKEDIKSYESTDGYTTVSVPDNRAHAWAEVYIDGCGWMSFEATPGYGNMALDLDGLGGGWETAAASEITSVSTAAPAFTEEPAESSAAIVTSTAVTTKISVTGSGEETEIKEEQTDSEITERDIPTGTGAAVSPGVQNPYGTEYQVGEDGTGGQPPSIETEIVKMEKTGSVPGFVKKILALSAAAAAAAGAVVFGRKTAFKLRRTGLSRDPSKAAVHMYRFLERKNGGKTAPEKLSEELFTKGIDREYSSAVILTALKARFGGGVTFEEAQLSAEALGKAVVILGEKRNIFGKALSLILVTDRYF